MSQAGILDIGSIPPPPGSVIQLTPDEGGAVLPVAGNINVFGQTAGSTQAMETHNVANNLTIEDRTWQTQFVVDASATIGLQGTYTTIQAAVTAAAALASANTINIFIRPGTYTEDPIIPAGVILSLTGGTQDSYYGAGGSVLINGTITFTVGTGSSLLISNIGLANLITQTNCSAILSNCVVVSITNPGTINASHSSLQVINSSNLTQLVDCVCASGASLSGSGIFTATKCEISAFSLADSAELILNYCQDINSISGTTSGLVIISNCSVNGTGPINFTGTVLYDTLSSGSSGLSTSFFGSNVTPQLTTAIQSNVFQSRSVSATGNVLNTDYYLAVTSAGGAVSLTMPLASSVLKNQTFIFKDVGANAATNSITILPNAAETFDGAASIILNNNYESVAIIFNGTNYNILYLNEGSISGFTWVNQATGIVLVVDRGYFVTAATTQTLPAAPAQGDVVKIVADTTGAVIVTANTGQIIRVGTTASSTAGTMTSSLQGDSLELVFRAATSTWISISTTGVWVPA